MATKEDSQNITITLPAEMVVFLDKLAEANDMSRSQVVRAAIRVYEASNK